MISYLEHSEIDKTKWDICIDNSPAGFSNVKSWYLDIVSPGWHAIVEDDYLSVMPLPVKRKFGILYIAQPLFIQQLGVFKIHSPDKLDISRYLKKIPGKIIRLNMNLNSFNFCSNPGIAVNKKTNQQINLSKDYLELTTDYSRGTNKSIRNLIKEKIQVRDSLSIEEFLEHKKLDPFIKLSPSTFGVLNRLLIKLDEQKLLHFYGAFNKNEKLCTVIGFFVDSKKVYLLISSTSMEGRDNKSMFAIIDRIVKDFSNKDLMLNFAGSNIEGVHFFNCGFGAKDEEYLNITNNHLPWPISILKP